MEKRRVIALLACLAMLSVGFSGCVSSQKSEKSIEQPKSAPENETVFSGKPHVVVAIIDCGINPYHEVFRRPNMTIHPSNYIDGYPKESDAINVTLDEECHFHETCWDNVERNKLYWIPGTNIVGAISFGEVWDLTTQSQEPGTPILDDNFHGTGVASILAKTCPDAYIIVIETGADCFERAMQWAVNQSWIDIISSSNGWNEFPGLPMPLWKNIPLVTKEGWGKGKIVINSGGNRILPPWMTYQAGPPWIISVGGANNATRGETVLAAKGIDYVSNFYLEVATHQSTNEYMIGAGTSLSAPVVAGTFASILLEIRRQLNYTDGIVDKFLINSPSLMISNTDLRNVVNKTSLYWEALEYNPLAKPPPPPGGDPFDYVYSLLMYAPSVEAPVVAPFLQMGWGYIGPEMVNDTVDILLGKKEWTPTLEKQLAEPYMNAIYELRRQFWENWPLGD